MLGLIGGTGLNSLSGLADRSPETCETPFGAIELERGRLAGQDLVFLPRHGPGHRLAPHQVNYRGNIWALQASGVTEVLAVAAVGGIAASMPPGALVAVDDLIDYSWGREPSFSGSAGMALQHLEFATPFCSQLREELIRTAASVPLPLIAQGVYGVTQGPRLETPAEIRRLRRDGCDVVGMTAMPEAALAGELGLRYALLAVVVNWAAGLSAGSIHADIENNLQQGMAATRQLIEALAAGRRAG